MDPHLARRPSRALLHAALALACLVAGEARGAAYHVRPEGNDAWPGTSPDSAWRTIARANAAARPGDVVYVWPNPAGYAHFPRPDSAGSNPTGGGRIAFVGASAAGDPVASAVAREPIRLPAGDMVSPYTTLRGLHVAGSLIFHATAFRCSLAASTVDGDLHLGSADHSVVSNCVGLGAYLSVAYVGAVPGDPSIGCVIEDSQFPSLGRGVMGGNHRFITGSTEVAKCDSLRFARNRLTTVIEDDLDSHPRVHFWTQHSEFRNNVHRITTTHTTRETYALRLRDSTMWNAFVGDTIVMTGSAPAIVYWSSSGDTSAAWQQTVGDNRVDSCYVNLIGSTGGSRMLFQHGMFDWTFRYNTLVCGGRLLDATDVKGKILIDHNTFVGGPWMGLIHFDRTPTEPGFSDTMTFTNNILYSVVPGLPDDYDTNQCAFYIHSQAFDSAGVRRLVSNNNLYAYYGYRSSPGDRSHRWDQGQYSRTGEGFPWNAAFGEDESSLYASPLFADSTVWSGFDARLSADSPARGAGTHGTDIGAVAFAPTVSATEPARPAPGGGLDAWPNPARGGLTVAFATARAAPARARVLDTAGRLVRTLHDGALEAGPHRLRWDGADARGRPAPPGVYFVEVTRDGETLARRVVMLR